MGSKKRKKEEEKMGIMDIINKEWGIPDDTINEPKIETFKVNIERNSFPRAKCKIVNGAPKYFFE